MTSRLDNITLQYILRALYDLQEFIEDACIEEEAERIFKVSKDHSAAKVRNGIAWAHKELHKRDTKPFDWAWRPK